MAEEVTSEKENKSRAASLANLMPFRKGEVRNPNGRPKGARSRFSEAFCQDILDDWQAHGIEAVRKVREDDPSTYLRVAASLIPKEFKFTEDDTTLDRFLNGLDKPELDNLIAGLCALGAAGKGEETGTEATPDERSAGIH